MGFGHELVAFGDDHIDGSVGNLGLIGFFDDRSKVAQDALAHLDTGFGVVDQQLGRNLNRAAGNGSQLTGLGIDHRD